MYPDLTTIDAVKAYLGLTSTTDDEMIAQLISSESALIQGWISRAFGVATYTDIFSGNGKNMHYLHNSPVVSIQSVTVNGSTVPAAATIQDAGYIVIDEQLTLLRYEFACGTINCQVVYTAGQVTPPDIAQACIELVSKRYRDRDRIGLVSKGLAGETTAYETKALPDHVKLILQQYKKVTPV